MMKTDSIKTLIFRYIYKVRDFSEKNKLTFAVYRKVFVPFHVNLLYLGNYRIGKHVTPKFVKALKRTVPKFITDIDKDPKKRKKVEKDIVKAFLECGVSPTEYFLYDFPHLGYDERRSYLSEHDRIEILYTRYNEETLEVTRNKYKFYELTKEYFHRDVCLISKNGPSEHFFEFIKQHPKFIAKPINGATGIGTSIFSANTLEEAKRLYIQLSEKDDWIVEELIIQHPEMAKWNETSVNTVRLPSFRTSQGERLLRPILRTGRKGSIVDNAGQGGLLASIDIDTGVIISEGIDKLGGRFECHPDNGIKFVGWQVPHWDELKSLAAKIHSILPEANNYIGFDFALSVNGWVLVEGNSLAQLGGQIALRKGAREEFYQLFKDIP